MKLRNKETGEIIEVGEWSVGIYSRDCQKFYHSIADFNEEWEDYKPKEPLIKDEKVRKAVRAWADANNIDSKRLYDAEVKFDSSEYRLRWIETNIEFNEIKGLENLADGAEYTIDELCGEEEE